MQNNTGAPSELAFFELGCAEQVSDKVCFGYFHMHDCQWPLLARSGNALIASASLPASTNLQYILTIGKHS